MSLFDRNDCFVQKKKKTSLASSSMQLGEEHWRIAVPFVTSNRLNTLSWNFWSLVFAIQGNKIIATLPAL